MSVDGRELIRSFLQSSPFARRVGLELEAIDSDRAELSLPFAAENATMGDVVHGGAIATLIDTAATAAAWATDFEEPPQRWGTASLTVNYLRPAPASDLTARAAVTRRGRALCYCDVEVVAGETVVAQGLVTYALS